MGIIAGYIVPHPPIAVHEIGGGREAEIQATLDSFDRVASDIAALAPETIVLTSPHSVLYKDYFHVSPGMQATGDFANFNAPEVRITADYDAAFAGLLDAACDKAGFPAGTMGERDPSLDHGTLVPLYFIIRHYTNFRLVRIGLSGLPLLTHYRFGEMIARTADELDRRTVFVASGDLAHCQKPDGPYGYRPEGPAYDAKLMETLSTGHLDDLLHYEETLLDRSMECGHRSFTILAGALSDKTYTIEPLSHEATFGVGYGFGICRVTGTKRACEPGEPYAIDPYVSLARHTVETFVRTGTVYEPPSRLPAMESQQAGVFVSIHKFGQLRGCIGTFLPTQATVTDELIQNAISAATRDPRFRPITADELAALTISVDILSEPEPVASVDALDAARYGVIVAKGQRRGLLLPHLDGVDTPLQQIAICKQKAGIPEDTDLASLDLYRFEVARHE